MKPFEGLEGDCCEEELSEVQVEFYKKALKEHEDALAETNNIKKDGISISKQGNVLTVKSTYQVKLQNTTTLTSLVMSQPKPMAPSPAVQTTAPSIPVTATRIQPSLSGATTVSSSLRTVTSQMRLSQPGAPTKRTEPIPLLPKPSEPSPAPHISVPKPKRAVPQPPPAPQVTVLTPSHPTAPSSPPPLAPIQSIPQPTLRPIQSAPPKKAVTSEEDSKGPAKVLASLTVVVKPSRTLPEIICVKKREALDHFVKSRLVLDARKFAEWLMQAGLVKSKQQGFCRVHNPNTPVQLQLRMYEDTTKFPNSGGYVWMTKCCDKNFVSIFRDSIFEDSVHAPSVLLKLIYHWACQTAVNNVVQWVKVDHAYIRSFYAMMRSACTVEMHTTTPVFGLSTINNRVEVGVISLGTTSTDGKRRDVKVEVLGVYEQESRKFRLRASEPVAGETRGKNRFLRILEPLKQWCSSSAIILTDLTVDRSALNDLGFENVVQKSFNDSSLEDRMTNRTIMDYLRKVVPKVFQSTLSSLSTPTIQQFLDELLWREVHGQSHSDAFHNMVRDLSTQSRSDTGIALVKRLSMIAANPFQDWGIEVKPPTSLLVEPQPHVSSILGASVPVKRSAPQPKETSHASGPSAPKEPRLSGRYATMHDLRKENTDDPRDAEVFCQISGCSKFAKSNLDMMEHIRSHVVKDTGSGHRASYREHCDYCLSSFPDTKERLEHEGNFHQFISSFKVSVGKEDNATIKELVCLICHDRFPSYPDLEHHLELSHVIHEMPYRCRVCFFHSSSHSLIIEHFLNAHKTSTQLLCPVCLEVFSMKGDNLANSPDVGHLKYLEHLKAHLITPSEARSPCKKCVLTFVDHDKLVAHWRTEHISFADASVARPFTFSVSKPQTSKGTPAMVSIPKAQAVAVMSSPPQASTSKTIKTYTKESLQEIPNITITKRYNLSVCEDSASGSHLCIECKDPLRKKNHFSGYYSCMSCRFSTSCGIAMRAHQNQAHKPPWTPLLGSVFALDRLVRCQCGFTSQGGIEVSRHMKKCGTSSVTVLS